MRGAVAVVRLQDTMSADRRRYIDHKRRGLCVAHGCDSQAVRKRGDVPLTLCVVHNQRMQADYSQSVARGECPVRGCSEPRSDTARLCVPHRDKARENARAYGGRVYAESIERGVCVRRGCYRLPARKPDGTIGRACAPCRLADRRYNRAMYNPATARAYYERNRDADAKLRLLRKQQGRCVVKYCGEPAFTVKGRRLTQCARHRADSLRHGAAKRARAKQAKNGGN